MAKKHSNPQQSQKFFNTAKKLGCDESEAVFDKKSSKLAQHKPAKYKPKDNQ